MTRLRFMLLAMAALFVAFSVNLPEDAATKAYHDKADRSLLAAVESAIVASERTTRMRPQSDGCDKDPVDGQNAAPRHRCDDFTIWSWPLNSIDPPYRTPVASAPARAPPTPTA